MQSQNEGLRAMRPTASWQAKQRYAQLAQPDPSDPSPTARAEAYGRMKRRVGKADRGTAYVAAAADATQGGRARRRRVGKPL